MKEQLASVVLQMYKAGVRCSEAVREFQKAFILTVLKDQKGINAKPPKNWECIVTPYAARSENWRLILALHEQRGGGYRCDLSVRCCRCGDGPCSYIPSLDSL